MKKLCRLGQLFHGGQLRRGGIAHAQLAVVVPDGQHAAHGCVHHAAGQRIHFLCPQQHVNDASVNGDRSVNPVLKLVDGAKVFKTVKAMINGKEVEIPELKIMKENKVDKNGK